MRLGAALVLIALAWLWLVSAQIPDTGTEWPGPRGFPVLLGVVLAVLGIVVAVQARMGRVAPRTDTVPKADTPEVARRDVGIALATCALLILFAFLLDRVGFLIATPLVVVLAMRGVLRMRRWVFIACFAVAVPLGCWVVFSALLGIPLPRGVWAAW